MTYSLKKKKKKNNYIYNIIKPANQTLIVFLLTFVNCAHLNLFGNSSRFVGGGDEPASQFPLFLAALLAACAAFRLCFLANFMLRRNLGSMPFILQGRFKKFKKVFVTYGTA